MIDTWLCGLHNRQYLNKCTDFISELSLNTFADAEIQLEFHFISRELTITTMGGLRMHGRQTMSRCYCATIYNNIKLTVIDNYLNIILIILISTMANHLLMIYYEYLQNINLNPT